MISLQNIALTYNDKKIFDHISWLITEKSRIGLVGDNGAGKTTLFRAIKGEISLDNGASEIPKNQRIGYLPQDLVELDPLPVQDYLKRRTGQEELEKNIQSFEDKIVAHDHRHPEYEAMLNKFDAASEAFHVRDGYGFDARARRILKGLGFANDDYLKNCREFSGGWKMRI
ncbi:MAG TPA: ATP-binding cassette domain-containing protein, partial [Candidatus Binatia bacterium]|nr:ATP-binding cassette domain-containing protein [Candidatus Binatia bacterium]